MVFSPARVTWQHCALLVVSTAAVVTFAVVPPAAADGSPDLQTLTLAAGCFWSVELVFQRIPGVISTSVGYTGGSTSKPRQEALSFVAVPCPRVAPLPAARRWSSHS
jgi:hypothetical protein